MTNCCVSVGPFPTQHNEDRSVRVMNMTDQNDFSSSNGVSCYIIISGVIVMSEATAYMTLMKQRAAVRLGDYVCVIVVPLAFFF